MGLTLMAQLCTFDQANKISWNLSTSSLLKKNNMKKTLNFIIVFFCFVAPLTFGCGGDDNVTPASCEDGISDYTAALNAYIADIENVAKCQALKKSLLDLIDCPGITAGQRAQYQADVNDIECQ